MDDPADTKRGLRAAYCSLLDLDFDLLLPAHGGPVSDGKQVLRAFAAAPARRVAVGRRAPTVDSN